ncbi:hypothetical protein HDV00_008307 [Rhizophlyctis rosea]|nr:hypothetical protein HDV00_008307 [Rhizophlyctis rosea]
MAHFASLAHQARAALFARDHKLFAALMNENLNTRQKLYGDRVIGDRNLEMIRIARQYGHAAKFSGSGGCVVGLWGGDGDDVDMQRKTRDMRDAFLKRGKSGS